MAKDFIFERQNKKWRSRKGYWLVLAVILFSALFFFRASLPGFLADSAVSVARPILMLKSGTMNFAEDFISVFYTKSGLIKENNELKQSLARLQGVEAELKLAQNENDSLRQSLSAPSRNKNSSFLSVILKPPSFPYDIFLANGGKDQGISAGDFVYAGEHVLVGQVAEVYSATSKIKFFSSPGEIVNASVGSSTVPIELIGMGGGNFYAKIPKGTDLTVGDLAYVENGGRNLIGVLASIDDVPNDSFSRGLVRVPVNLYELSYVSMEKSASYSK